MIPGAGVELYRASPGPYKNRSQTWRFRFRAGNGRVLAVASESYTNRADAIAAMQIVFGQDVVFADLDAVAL